MKYRKNIRLVFRFSIMFSLLLLIGVTACKKDKIDDGDADSSAIEQLSNDEINIEAVVDDALTDAEGVLSVGGGFFKSGDGLPCNATLDSSGIVHDSVVMYITYTGLNCNGTRNRTGQIEIKRKVGTHWGQPGCSIRIRYINYTVTRVSSGKTVTMNGIKTYQNVSGGFIWQVGNSRTSVIQRISGNLTIGFDDGNTRTWNLARQHSFTGSMNNLMLTVDGFGTEGNYNNLLTWGTTRSGEYFFTQVSQSVVHRQSCDFDPVSGVKVHMVPSVNKSATITFGYNANNEPVSGDGCPTKYRIDWTHGSHSGTKYLIIH